MYPDRFPENHDPPDGRLMDSAEKLNLFQRVMEEKSPPPIFYILNSLVILNIYKLSMGF